MVPLELSQLHVPLPFWWGSLCSDAPLVALEATPFVTLLLLLLIPCLDVHGLFCPSICLCRHRVPSALCVAPRVSTRGTCCATYSLLGAAGGSNLLEASWLLVVTSVTLTDAMVFVVGSVSLSLLVHDENSLLPLVVCLGNADPDIRNDRGVRPWHPLSYGGDHGSAAIRIVAPACQFGLVFQLLEEDGGRIAPHLHVLHPLFVLFFNGRIPKYGP